MREPKIGDFRIRPMGKRFLVEEYTSWGGLLGWYWIADFVSKSDALLFKKAKEKKGEKK